MGWDGTGWVGNDLRQSCVLLTFFCAISSFFFVLSSLFFACWLCSPQLVSNLNCSQNHFHFPFFIFVDQYYLFYSLLFVLFSSATATAAPTVAFGGLTNIITDGHIGVIEFIISCGAGGMFYSLFSGQPMTFVGPTGAWPVHACMLMCVCVCVCLAYCTVIKDARTQLEIG